MRMYDLIDKKKHGEKLSEAEIRWMIENYVNNTIPDYQMSAMLMAIYFMGMDDDEIFYLTDAMEHSGNVMDFSEIEGVIVDKHSTGGVGDKTTLIIAPIVAACGAKVAKMSGRGLGFTGGTVDKLESIDGFRIAIEKDEFIDIVNKHGLCVVGQSSNLTPADKKLYALRDVTATVDSIPLIAASIMSKKLAAGSDCILLDVKTGKGAFMSELEDAKKLADVMISIGEKAGKKMAALITDMDVPLGCAIGNSLEVIEAVETLKGKGPEDLTQICVELSANMLCMALELTYDEAVSRVKEVLDNGKAYEKLIEMVEAQGGDTELLKDTSKFRKAEYVHEVLADRDGYITAIDSKQCGIASVVLEAGRETKESEIDYSAGIILKKKLGDYVKKGDVLAQLYTGNAKKIENASKIVQNAYTISIEQNLKRLLILGKINNFLK